MSQTWGQRSSENGVVNWQRCELALVWYQWSTVIFTSHPPCEMTFTDVRVTWMWHE